MQEIEYSTKNEANSLIIERDILTKTIFRVYQQDSHLTKIQRDKLLTRYQYQLAVVVSKIEELGNAMRNTGTNHLDEDQKTKLMSLSGVKQFPMRVKCATLSWHTLNSAMERKTEEVNTEAID